MRDNVISERQYLDDMYGDDPEAARLDDYLQEIAYSDPAASLPDPVQAAAPDLLAALIALFDNCEMIHKHWGDGDNTKDANAAITAARAAISKAQGA